MILASTNKGDIVLDPFSGSGTTMRVCQQIGRKGIGIELNPEYVEMTKQRLSEDFTSFDSVDPKMERVPNDLRKPEIRDEYLKNHIGWFLKNHDNAIDVFTKAVKEKYGLELEAKQKTDKNKEIKCP